MLASAPTSGPVRGAAGLPRAAGTRRPRSRASRQRSASAGAAAETEHHYQQHERGGSSAGAAAVAHDWRQHEAEAQERVRQLITRRSFAPPRYIGPVRVSRLPGKRYGLVASENVAVGALLMVVPPLAVAFGPTGAPPSNAELAEQLGAQQLSAWQLQWLHLLLREEGQPPPPPSEAGAAAPATAQQGAASGRLPPQPLQQQGDGSGAGAGDSGGPPSSGGSGSGSSDELALLQRLLLEGEPAAAAAAAAAAGGAGEASAAASPPSAEQLLRVVCENAYGVASEDAGAALLRELEPLSAAGVWPEYALVNHDCAPNTAAAVVGRYLLVRAAAPLLAGEELTASYLGRRGFSPVAGRRAFLSGTYGFHCCCERCLAEQATFPTRRFAQDGPLLGGAAERSPDAEAEAAAATQPAARAAAGARRRGAAAGRRGAAGGRRRQPPRRAAARAAAAAGRASGRAAVGGGRRGAAAGRAPGGRAPRTGRRRVAGRVGAAAARGAGAAGGAAAQQRRAPAGWPRPSAAAAPAAAAGRGRRRGAAALGGALSGGGALPAKRQLLGLYVELLDRCLTAVDAVARGSEAHVELAVKHMDAARALWGAGAEQMRLAEGLCGRAHAARYGAAGGGGGGGAQAGEQQRQAALVAALVAARRRRLLGASLARRMGVLAWEGSLRQDGGAAEE